MTWITLDKADGPKCPNCGCRETEILKGTNAGTWFGGRQLSKPMVPLGDGRYTETTIKPELSCQGTALCNHCGQRFAVRRPPADAVVPEAADAVYDDVEPIVDAPAEIAEDLVAAKKVPMVRLLCPACKSPKVRVQSTKRPTAKSPGTRTWRNHVCLDCDHTFQTFEETESER